MVLSPEQIEQTNLTVPCNTWHNHCKLISHNIIACVNYPHYTINNTTLLKYLMYLENNSCIEGTNHWIDAVIAICKKIIPSVDNQRKIVRAGYLVIPIFENLIKNEIKIDSSVLESTIKYSAERSYDTRFKLIEFLVNHVVATNICLETVCRFRFIGYVNNFYERQCFVIRSILNQKIEATPNCLIYAIEVGNSMLVELLIQYGCQVTENSMISACKHRNKASLIRILQCRIPPTKKAYQHLFSSLYSYAGIECRDAKLVAELIDILVANGYKVDYEDVLYALRSRCYINEISRFNIKFDGLFIEECARQRYYPYADQNINVKPTIECLRIECEQVNSIAQIKRIVSQGVRPNMDCLRAACTIRTNNTVTLRYLLSECNMKPDLKCLKLSTGNSSNIDVLLEATEDSVNKDYIEKQQLINDKLDKEQAIIDLKILKEMEKKQLLKDDDDKVDDIIEENKDKQKDKSKSKSKTESDDDDVSDMQKLTDDLNLSEEFEDFDIDFVDTKRKKNKLKNVNIIGSSDTSKEIKLKERPSPDNKRLKIVAKPDVLKLFGVRGAANAKVSYFDIRKLLLTYITDNDLYDKKDQTIIRPDKDLCKVLKLGTYKGRYISFKNFDNLVNLCYPT